MKSLEKRYKLSLYAIIAVLLLQLIPLSFYTVETSAQVQSNPFVPHEIRVLVVSSKSANHHGQGYILSDLARFGFNITWLPSDGPVDYLTDSRTSNLAQYDVVLLYSTTPVYQPGQVTEDEIRHFTNFGGILVAIGDSLFWNETAGTWWTDVYTNSPISSYLEPRLGVDFEGLIGAPVQNNGTFTKISTLIPNLPEYLNYTDLRSDTGFQFGVSATYATVLYDFTAHSARKTTGITYYQNSTGAVGIYINGLYLYATETSNIPIYRGLKNIAQRTSFIGRVIAFALNRDSETVVKPQPLATIRLDWLGRWGLDETYLNAALSNFDSILDANQAIPSIEFTDVLDASQKYWREYWQKNVPNILSQLRGKYRDWEYSSSLRNTNTSSLTEGEIRALVENMKGNYTALGMDLFSTVATSAGFWNLTTLNAMVSENLILLDMAGEPQEWGLGRYYPDWWNSRVISNVIVHSGARMGVGWNYEYFTQINSDVNVAKNILHGEYFKNRDKWALAIVNGFPSFVYNVWHFRAGEVGTYSLQTVFSNLTSEIPDIRFVPLVEAASYFGNKWVDIENSTRINSVIEFDVDSSAIPDVVNIGKGMLWLMVDSNETIKEVSINNQPWFYFDDHSIRMPANSVHVKVTLGTRTTPTVIRTVYKVTETVWDGQRLTVSVSATPDLNVSIRLSVPLWDAFCSESSWNYTFDMSSRILEIWAISDADGWIVFRVGADVTPPSIVVLDRSPPWYNSSVSIVANITDLQAGVGDAVLSYSPGADWINTTMVITDNLYVGTIPAFPYGTVVQYRLNASDVIWNWRVSENSSYNVTDQTPPDIGVIEWTPAKPSKDQSVLVTVSVSEPEFASGVQNVVLYYYYWNESGWLILRSVEMESEGGLWWADIPSQRAGTEVGLFVKAFDNAGNFKMTPQGACNFTIVGNEEANDGGTILSPWLILFVGGVGTVVLVGAVVYFAKFRRPKGKGQSLNG